MAVKNMAVMGRTYLLSLLAAIYTPVALGEWPPDDQELRGSLSNTHLEMVGGLEALRRPFSNASKLHVMMVAEERDFDSAEETECFITKAISLDTDSYRFKILGVECGESICEIQTVGDSPESLLSWERLVDDIRKQSWNDFNQVSQSSQIVDDQFVILTHMLRDGSKYKHCFVNPDEDTCPDPTASAAQ